MTDPFAAPSPTEPEASSGPRTPQRRRPAAPTRLGGPVFGLETPGDDACLVRLDGTGRVRAAAPGRDFPLAVAAGGALAALFAADDRDALTALAETRRATVRARLADGRMGAFELRALDRRARRALIVDRTAEAERTARLAERAEAAEASGRAGATRIADLSHEMKTPLTAVIGFAEAIQSAAFGPVGAARYREYAGHIRASGAHLLDLVTTLLDLARLDADRFALKPARVDPAALTRECAAMVAGAAAEAGLALDVETPADLGDCVLDPRASRQILLNLLTNAVKFTRTGSVSATVARDGDRLVFTVRDTGIGMTPETLARLGPRYTRARGDGVRGTKGAGLGLALAMRLAEAQGGRIRIDSAPGAGTTAEVALPFVAPPRRAARPDAAEEEPADEAAHEPALGAEPGSQTVASQLERIEAYRREAAARRAA